MEVAILLFFPVKKLKANLSSQSFIEIFASDVEHFY